MRNLTALLHVMHINEVFKNSKHQQEIKRQQQKRQATLEKSAKAWLKKLDPHSDEGLWFTEFAYAYDSQLAAAIDYLSAMQETKQKP